MEERQGGRERAKEKRNGMGKDGREGGRDKKERTDEQKKRRNFSLSVKENNCSKSQFEVHLHVA